MPRVWADQRTAEKIKFGQKLSGSDFESIPDHTGQFIRVTDYGNNLLSIVQPDENGLNYKYSCVFSS